MFKIMLALHLLFAIFAIGPLVHAATTAVRGVRQADAGATAYSARMARIYAYLSILVVVFGFALMSSTSPHTHQDVAKFGETWIWLSLLLWLISVATVLVAVVPGLDQATKKITSGGSARELSGRIAAGGGIAGILLAVVVFLMVYQPGA
jgi:hypothetical protein